MLDSTRLERWRNVRTTTSLPNHLRMVLTNASYARKSLLRTCEVAITFTYGNPCTCEADKVSVRDLFRYFEASSSRCMAVLATPGTWCLPCQTPRNRTVLGFPFELRPVIGTQSLYSSRPTCMPKLHRPGSLYGWCLTRLVVDFCNHPYIPCDGYPPPRYAPSQIARGRVEEQ